MEKSKNLSLYPTFMLVFRFHCHVTQHCAIFLSLAGKYFVSEQEKKTGKEKTKKNRTRNKQYKKKK